MKRNFVSIVVIGLLLLGSTTQVAKAAIELELEKMDFFDPNSGWIWIDQHLYWTDTAGSTWNDITPPIIPGAKVHDIEFFSVDSGWVLAESGVQAESRGFLLISTRDQGKQWGATNIEIPILPDEEMERADLHWLDLQTGWLEVKMKSGVNFSVGKLFLTKDAGVTWQEVSIPIAGTVHFLSQNDGWLLGGVMDNQLFMTNDTGITWREVTIPTTVLDETKILNADFLTSMAGTVVTSQYNEKNGLVFGIYQTQDAGITWSLVSEYNLDAESEFASASIYSGTTPSVIISTDENLLRYLNNEWVSTQPFEGVPSSFIFLDWIDASNIWGIWHNVTCEQGSTLVSANNCQIKTGLAYSNTTGSSWQFVGLPNGSLEAVSQYLTPMNKEFNTPSMLSVDGISANNTQKFQGQGFDRCEVPTSSQLQTWWSTSPYKVVNLYFGGSGRGCANSAITNSFVKTISQQGWKFIPTWVGPQSSCNGLKAPDISTNKNTAYNQGVAEAKLAVERMYQLGFTNPDKSGTVIYYDLESYTTSNTTCREAAKAFINGWVTQLHAHGNIAGVYGSSCASAINDFASIANVPDVIWPAATYISAYDPNAGTNVPCIPNTSWANHQRIRQYTPGHNEKYGGITLTIDSNVIDGVVAVPYSGGVVTPNAPTGVSATDAAYADKTVVTWNSVSGATSYQIWKHTSGTSSAAANIGTSTSTSFEDTGGYIGKTYYYWVKACNSAGCSNFSSFDTGYRQEPGVIVAYTPSLTPAYSGDMCGSAWYRFTGYQGVYAYLTLNTNSSAQSTNSGVWQPNLPISGNYKVEAYIPSHGQITWQCPTKTITSDTADARYKIYHASGTTTIAKNQSPVSNGWLDLGTYSFNQGTSGKVALTDLNGESNLSRTISFNVLRFTLQSSTQPNPFGKNEVANGSTYLPASVHLSWSTSTGANEYQYCIDTINNNSCDENWFSTGSSTSGMPNLLSNTTYFWQVKAINSSGTTFADENNWWSFTTAPAVYLERVWTANKDWNEKIKFDHGEDIMYVMTITNSTDVDQTISADYLTLDVNGTSTVHWSGELTIEPGSWYWGLDDLISNEISGERQFVGRINYNGVTSQKSAMFHVGANIFEDVTPDYWAWSWIERLYSAGVTGGCQAAPLQYCPEQLVTRAQMAVFIERSLHGRDFSPSGGASYFNDISGHWAQNWIDALRLDGITGGCSPAEYCPEASTTRAQMAIFLLRSIYGVDYVPPVASGTKFLDVPADYWAAGWIEQLAQEGITGGCGNGAYCPDSPVTRAQMAVFLIRAFGLP